MQIVTNDLGFPTGFPTSFATRRAWARIPSCPPSSTSRVHLGTTASLVAPLLFFTQMSVKLRTLPCRWLESHTVTANSLPCSTEPVAATIWRSSSRWRLTLLSACSTCRAFKPGPYRHRPQVSALWRILLASDIHTFGRYHGLRPRVPQADSC